MNTPQPETNTRVTRRKRLLRWSLSALAVVVIAVGAFVWWFFRGDAPDAVSIGDAAAQVAGSGRAMPPRRWWRRPRRPPRRRRTSLLPRPRPPKRSPERGRSTPRSASSATRTRRGRSSGSASTRSSRDRLDHGGRPHPRDHRHSRHRRHNRHGGDHRGRHDGDHHQREPARRQGPERPRHRPVPDRHVRPHRADRARRCRRVR